MTGGCEVDNLVKYIWRLIPSDFLPAGEEFTVGGHTFRVHAEGKEVLTTMEEHDFNHTIIQSLEKHLRCYLDAVRLKEFKAYELRVDARTDKNGMSVFVEPAGGAGVGNVLIIDTHGSVVHNAKEEECRKRQKEVLNLQRLAEIF